MPDQEPAEATRESAAPGSTRRGVLRGAAGIGAAGLAAGVFAGAVGGPADAATRGPEADAAAVKSKTLTVHIADSSTGEIDVFHGEEHVRLVDRQIAARLAKAAG